MIKPDQVYIDCDPRGGATIRILRYTPGDARAQVARMASRQRYATSTTPW
ncbi:hypothetical protein ACIQC7_35150 [Kitasatospora sp. NPDC088556]